MSISLEALIVSLFLILPGFAATLVQRSVQYAVRGVSDEMPVGAATWAAISLIRGLALNVVAAAIFILFVIDIDLTKQLKDLKQVAGEVPLRTAIHYVVALYVLAVIWGALNGIANKFELLQRLYLRGWTSVSPFPNVFRGAVKEFFRGDAAPPAGGGSPQVPWVIVKSKDRPTLVGRLHGGNLQIESDKPFEVVLRHAFYLSGDKAVPLEELDGLEPRVTYLHITPDMQVHILAGSDTWRPTFPPPEAVADPTPKAGFRFLGGSFYCEGASERAAHPGVFIPLDESGQARCSYCNQAFGFGPIDGSVDHRA